MKRFNDLTDEEVLLLTDDDVAAYIDVECAYAGVPLPGPEPVKPPDYQTAPNKEVWLVTSHLAFSNYGEAQDVADLLRKCTSRVGLGYVPGPRFDRLIEEAGEIEFKKVPAFTREAWENVKVEAEAADERQKQYREAKDAYRKALEARENIARPITERVRRVARHEERRLRFLGLHQQYLALAEGDQHLAARFLLNAYPEADTFIPGLKDEAFNQAVN